MLFPRPVIRPNVLGGGVLMVLVAMPQVFFMDPEHGATTEPVVFAQLTVPSGTSFAGQLSAQGKSKGGAKDWDTHGLRFSNIVAGGKVGVIEGTDDLSGGSGAEQASCPQPSETLVVKH